MKRIMLLVLIIFFAGIVFQNPFTDLMARQCHDDCGCRQQSSCRCVHNICPSSGQPMAELTRAAYLPSIPPGNIQQDGYCFSLPEEPVFLIYRPPKTSV